VSGLFFAVAYLSLTVLTAEIHPPYRGFTPRQKKIAWWVFVPSFFCFLMTVFVGAGFLLAFFSQKAAG
jgi:hypothetical protein